VAIILNKKTSHGKTHINLRNHVVKTATFRVKRSYTNSR